MIVEIAQLVTFPMAGAVGLVIKSRRCDTPAQVVARVVVPRIIAIAAAGRELEPREGTAGGTAELMPVEEDKLLIEHQIAAGVTELLGWEVLVPVALEVRVAAW